MSLRISEHISLKKDDIWFQDEVCFDQQNTTTRVWAVKGSRQRVVKQQQYGMSTCLVLCAWLPEAHKP